MMAKNCVIVTLQKTSYDDEATLKINANCDDVMKFLVNDLKEYEYSIDFKVILKKNEKTFFIKLESGI
jgi:hypothetical protein